MGREPDTLAQWRALGGQLATFRLAAGLTQGELAARVYCDRTTIAHLERGRRGGSPDLWHAIDAAVDAYGALARGYGELIAAQDARAAHDRGTALARVRAHAEQLRHQHDNRQDVRRDHHQEAQVALSGSLAGDDGSRGVDAPGIAAIRAMSDSFQMADRRIGGGVLYGQVVRYIKAEIAPTLLDPPGGCSSADLFSAAASFTEVAGWMAHDSGRNDKAQTHFGQAFRLATVAGNPVLSANTCASLAHLAIQLGQADVALRVGAAGLHRATGREGAGHLVARLHAMRARAHAQQGDEPACRRSLDASRDTLERATDDTGHVGWIAEFDDASLAGEAALCLYNLGHLTEAEAQARTVLALRVGDRVRSRAFGQLTLGNILHAAGRPAEAASIGTDLCAIAPGLTSTRVHTGLASLANTLAAHRTVPEVGVFLDHAAALQHHPRASHTDIGWPL